MATPHVSGLASLLKGFNTNLTNDDIEQIIRLTADDRGAVGWDNQFGTGRINAERALQSLQAPNQLFHWSVTGGAFFNTSGNETKIFLGVPGFADAAYIVKRSEIRTNVTFPAAMCTMIGAWGRGVGTTGYREEQGRCFGEGICEVVPGTLTNTGATLRTWIYEVWGVNGQYYGFFPKSVSNVVFQYTVLGVPLPNSISGDNTVCTTSNYYTITNLPTGATVTWTASPSGIATINSPGSTQTTLTKNNDGTITLTATITNLCGGDSIVINKKIVVGYTQILNISYPSSTVAPDELIPMQIFVAPDSFVIGNQKLVIKRMGGGYTDSIYTGGDGAVEFSFPTTGTYNIKVYTYNDCGWSTSFYPLVFFCTNDEMFMLSPNPANTSLAVKLSDETVQSDNIKSRGTGIKEIQLTDKMGNVLKRYVYHGTDKQVTIDVSALKADIYYIKLFNGKRWIGKSFMKQ
ncbi:MAG: hypothetical protein JST63_09935 [Bacteroidetes bacterium]|nr:hypothetical protein [Bacteroidota bacterium]